MSYIPGLFVLWVYGGSQSTVFVLEWESEESMDALSLEELTAQLQTVQQKKAVVRLSERNVVELVNKLKELGFLDPSLLHTINGKEYLTQKQLRVEIEEALISAGGRISLPELCSCLKVDLSHCERQSAYLVEQSSNGILSVQEELITQDYLRSLAVDINERVQTTGMTRIGDLAIQYGLSLELLLSVVSEHLGSFIDGELLNNMLYTETYRDRIKAQLRGGMRGATSPITLSSLLKHIHLEDSGISDIIQKIVQDLLQSGDIKAPDCHQGELRTNGQWVPEPEWLDFVVSCTENYIDRDSTFLETVLAEVEDYAEKETWCDLHEVVPTEFTDEDIRLLLNHSASSVQASFYRITDTCLLALSFLEALKQRVKIKATQYGEDGFFQNSDMKKTPEEGIGSVKGQGKEEEVDEKGKVKKKRRNKAKGKQTNPGPKAAAEDGIMQKCPTAPVITQLLITWYPESEDVSTLPESIAELLLPTAVSAFKQTIEFMMQLTEKRRQELKDISLINVEESLGKLWIYAKGVESMTESVDSDIAVLLKKHLVKSTGYEALDWLLRFLQLHEPGSDEQVPNEAVPIAAAERVRIVDALADDMKPAAANALQTIKQEDIQDILDAMDAGLECCGIRFPKRDKKAEKQMLQQMTVAWKETLEQETVPASALQLILPLVVAQMKGIGVNLPGKAMPVVIEHLKTFMQPGDHEMLSALHKAVVKDLQQKSSKSVNTESDEIDEELIKLVVAAKTLVQRMS